MRLMTEKGEVMLENEQLKRQKETAEREVRLRKEKSFRFRLRREIIHVASFNVVRQLNVPLRGTDSNRRSERKEARMQISHG